MSRIDELLKDEKVEWKSLGEVCEIKRGRGLKKEDKGSGNIPAILYGELYTTYGNYINNVVTNIDEKLCKSSVLIKKNSLLLPISSTTKEAQIGKASVLKVDEIYLGSDAIALIPNDLIIPDYLMYYLNSNLFEIDKMKNVNGTTIRHLSVIGISSIKIPIPSLETQEKIVKILDEFTKSVTELQNNLKLELDKRTKQYEYYRDLLLSEKYLKKLSNLEKIKRVSLGQIGEIQMCKRVLKNMTTQNGDVPFYKISTFGKKADAYISKELFEEYKLKYNYPKKGEILISASGTIGKTVIFDGKDAYFQDSNIIWVSHNEDLVINKYLYYYYQIINWKPSTGGTISRIYNYNLKTIELLLPPISIQKKVVKILDKFDKLANDVKQGLPREIELRQKQYEYYRERLLSF